MIHANAKLLVKNNIVNIKNSLFFLAPSVIALFINLFTFPIFSRNMTSHDFAVMGYFESISQIFLPVMNLSFYSYYMKDFFKRTPEENKTVQVTLMIFLTGSNLILVSVGLLLLFTYFELANVSFPLFPYALISLSTIYFMTYAAFLGIEYKMRKEGFKFFALQCISILIPISISLYLVVNLGLGAIGKMTGLLIAQLLIGILAFKLLYKKIKFDFKIIKKALVFGYPLIIVALLDFPTLYLDSIILERQNNVNKFALYSIGLKMAGIIFMLGSAVYQAFEPDFYKFVSQKRIKKFAQSTILVFGFLFIINIGFTVFSKTIISLLTSDQYTDAYQYANLIIWSNYFLLLSYLLGVIMIVQNKTKLLMYRKFILVPIGIIVFFVFIDQWQFIGAGYAKIIINLFNCVLLICFIISSSGGIKKFNKVIVSTLLNKSS
ncbi:lipopolysaccharide biosynthesis protein [Sporosarcina sp. CAU 1771]